MDVPLNSFFFACFLYADDIMLLSPSVLGLLSMLDICVSFRLCCNVTFNAKVFALPLLGRNSNLSLGLFLL